MTKFFNQSENFPAEMKERPHWLFWKLVQKEDQVKPSKVPYSPSTMKSCDPTLLNCLAPFDLARYRLETNTIGLDGFGFSLQGGIVCIDLDNCINENGHISSWAESILEKLPSSYAEISQSGKGLHWFGLGTVNGSRTKFTLDGEGVVEIYQEKRYIAMTGELYSNSPATLASCQEQLAPLYAEWMKTVSIATSTPRDTLTTTSTTHSDVELLESMFNSRHGQKIQALWEGDIRDYRDDDSSADLALLAHLAFWTNGDAKRIESLFNQSALSQRDKWQKRKDYRQRSIERVLENFSEGYQPKESNLRMKGVDSANEHKPTEKSTLKTITHYELMTNEYQPIQWIIPNFLPEGLTLLVGAPKIGKSWLSLDICQSVAFGSESITPERIEQGECLYLALEDGERRLQNRFQMIQNHHRTYSKALHLCNEIPRANQGGLQLVESWLDEHPHCRLVIVDTLQRFREQSTRGAETYASDYEALIPLQTLARDRRIALVMVHHTRKMEAKDPFDKISGTTAIMGAADCVWLLSRGRGENEGKLSITGRDLDEHELLLKFEKSTCQWKVTGDASAMAASQEENDVLELMSDITKPITPKELGIELDISSSAAKMRLQRLMIKGLVEKLARGQYALAPNKVTEGHTEGVTNEFLSGSDFTGESNKVTGAFITDDGDTSVSSCDLVTLGANTLPTQPYRSNTQGVPDSDLVTIQSGLFDTSEYEGELEYI